MVSHFWRPAALALVAVAVTLGLSAPLTPNGSADAAGDAFEVSDWTDDKGKKHRIRWNPCQTAVTYAVNAQLAGGSPAARDAAVADVQTAFHRVSRRTGINFEFAGRTGEIPNNGGGDSWATRQRAAEIVVAWVDQSRAQMRSNLMTNSGSGYPSGIGGWMMRTWLDDGGNYHAAIGRGFVVINAGHNRLYRPGFGGGTTRGALLLHEIAHAVGLGHAGTTREIMYPTMLDRERSVYRDGDREGLSRVGRSLGCIPGASTQWPQI